MVLPVDDSIAFSESSGQLLKSEIEKCISKYYCLIKDFIVFVVFHVLSIF